MRYILCWQFIFVITYLLTKSFNYLLWKRNYCTTNKSYIYIYCIVICRIRRNQYTGQPSGKYKTAACRKAVYCRECLVFVYVQHFCFVFKVYMQNGKQRNKAEYKNTEYYCSSSFFSHYIVLPGLLRQNYNDCKQFLFIIRFVFPQLTQQP